jgi:hypothetical protein
MNFDKGNWLTEGHFVVRKNEVALSTENEKNAELGS